MCDYWEFQITNSTYDNFTNGFSVLNNERTEELFEAFFPTISLDLLNLLVYHGIVDARYIGKLHRRRATERLSN